MARSRAVSSGDRHGASVHAPEQPDPLEDGQVAADGLGRHAVGLRQVEHGEPAALEHERGDRLLALLGVHPSLPARASGQGSTVTLIASPFLTIEKASSTRSSGMCSVIRSLTGTWPVEMYSSARLLCSGAEPLAPWMCSCR